MDEHRELATVATEQLAVIICDLFVFKFWLLPVQLRNNFTHPTKQNWIKSS